MVPVPHLKVNEQKKVKKIIKIFVHLTFSKA